MAACVISNNTSSGWCARRSWSARSCWPRRRTFPGRCSSCCRIARTPGRADAAVQSLKHFLEMQTRVNTRKRVRVIKGSHIIVPRLHDGDHASILQNKDSRIVFVIPYEREFALIGTTDIPVEMGEEPVC